MCHIPKLLLMRRVRGYWQQEGGRGGGRERREEEREVEGGRNRQWKVFSSALVGLLMTGALTISPRSFP